MDESRQYCGLNARNKSSGNGQLRQSVKRTLKQAPLLWGKSRNSSETVEEKTDIQKAFALLDKDEKAVVYLYYCEGVHGFPDIVKRTGIPMEGMEVLLDSGFDKICRYYGEGGEA